MRQRSDSRAPRVDKCVRQRASEGREERLGGPHSGVHAQRAAAFGPPVARDLLRGRVDLHVRRLPAGAGVERGHQGVRVKLRERQVKREVAVE